MLKPVELEKDSKCITSKLFKSDKKVDLTHMIGQTKWAWIHSKVVECTPVFCQYGSKKQVGKYVGPFVCLSSKAK